MSGVISMLIFGMNRALILRRKNSRIAVYALPPLVFLTIFINMFFILYKGAKTELAWDANKAAWVSVVIASGCSILSGVIGIPLLRRKAAVSMIIPVQDNSFNFLNTLANITNQSTATYVNTDDNIPIGKLADNNETKVVENLSEDIENLYKYLQVFSSCCVAFAHGANDVANAIGPYGAIWYVYNNRSISNSVETPRWMLVLGGIGIVVGLWTYGYNVIKALGGELCALSPSRGYSAELATALTVSFASVYGIPISTTHCIVGAEVGICLLENMKTGVNWKLFGKTFTAWIFTLIISGALSALLFSQGIYAPSVIMSTDIEIFEDGIKNIMISKGVANESYDAEDYIKYINETCV
jgi:sodium-dependent phosphate transporter